MRFRNLALAWLVVATLAPATSNAEPAGPLRLEAKIPLGNVAGRIDHMAFDIARNRLFVAELGNGSVGVVDIAARKVIHRITGLKEPQGVGYLKQRDAIYVASGGDGSVRIYKGDDFAPAGSIALGDDADNVRLDETNRVIVGYGKGALAIIDPESKTRIADIPLKAHPESFQLDPDANRIFVNLPDTKSIGVINKAGNELANWRAPHRGNYAMALDNEKQRVLVAFRSPPKLVAFAKDTGAVVADVDTCGDVDDLFIDAKRQRVYVICGTGFIDVLDAAAYRRLARITTVQGARTGLFVADLDLLVVGARASGNEPAAIWVYRAGADSGKP